MQKLKFQPHVNILRLIEDLRFGCGKMLVAAVLTGEANNQVKKLRLNKKAYFSSLTLYSKEDVLELLDILIAKNYLEYSKESGTFYKTLKLTEKGKNELRSPSDVSRIKNGCVGNFCFEKITKEDAATFESLGDALSGMSDEQKKCVIHTGERLLCIAGAGSGKTRVLTQRAKFLAKYRNVPEENILAITFTRKARNEMKERLAKEGCYANVETFNSFCEKILRKHESEIYGKPVKVMDFKSQKNILLDSLREMNLSARQAIDIYFTKKKASNEDEVTLFLKFMYDMYALLDYQKNNAIKTADLISLIRSYSDKELSYFVSELAKKIIDKKESLCLRDFSDQILHTIEFFRKNKDKIPIYSHILVDEYQDVNDMQVELLDILNPQNFFAVGDPRQSIYGWRGSKVSHILGFSEKYPNCKILQLTENHRSTSNIVEMANAVIKPMRMPDLKARNNNGDPVAIVSHDNEESELKFIIQSILSQDTQRSEIFVLARTNKQLDVFEPLLLQAEIKYLKRTTEISKEGLTPDNDMITLSTVHAIKGLEADIVYLAGADTQSFPCMASEHPVLEIVKANDNYDKYDEELRVFYVALSRAKKKLIINHHNNLTVFLKPSSMKNAKEIDLGIKKGDWKFQKTTKDDFLRDEDLVY
ncbi:MAG: UvrD-helicase domain-containing protein [archaeon]